MTEYLGKINNTATIMLMVGEVFSIIPYTTHINIKNVNRSIKFDKVNLFIKNILISLKKEIYQLNFKKIFFLCYNPHCGENGTIGKEDFLIEKIVKKFKKIHRIIPADSAFNKIEKNTLFISTFTIKINTF